MCGGELLLLRQFFVTLALVVAVVLCLVVECVVVVSTVVLSVVEFVARVSCDDGDEGIALVVGEIVESAVVLLIVAFVVPIEVVGGSVVRVVVTRGVVVVFGTKESTTPTGPSRLTSASGQVSSSG